MKRIASPVFLCCITAILLTSVFAATLGAQTASVRLEGITWNPSGDPIAGVVLTAVEDETGRQYEAISDNDGYYRFLALPPGTYTVTAKIKDFKDVILRGISLFSPESITENFSFEVSAIDRVIPVSDAARANDSANSGTFPRHKIEALPLLDQDPLSLLIFQPGIQINGAMENDSTVNGTRKGMNRIFMDGISISDPTGLGIGNSMLSLNTDSVADVQIMTSGAKAEFGGSGGGYFVIASRTGTKSWKGSIYDYFRNKSLDANEFFTNAAKLPRQGLTRNVFGGSASGPLGNKTLIFANLEANRTNQTRHANSIVLREKARTGIFQWYEPDEPTQNETTVRSFNIPANDPRGLGIDPGIATQLARFPAEDSISRFLGDGLNTGGYLYEYPTHTRQERLSVRLDHEINKNHRFFFRFNWQHTDAIDTESTFFLTYADELRPNYRDNSWALAGGSDWTISPHAVNELRIGYTNPDIRLERPGRLKGAMPVPNSWSNQQDTSFQSSYKTPGFDISDTFSHSMNVHSLKYGASFRRSLQKSVNFDRAYPTVTLGLGNGNRPAASIGPSEQSEISERDRRTFEMLYNDLLGRIESVSLTYNSSLSSVQSAGTPSERSYASNEISLFVQDDWKIRRSLTLNLGLRYDIFTAPKEKNGFQSVLDKASLITNSSEIPDFSVAGGDKWYSTDWKNFAPRAGFAWDIKENGSLVLRGGYGMYFDRLNGTVTRFVDQNSYGFSQPLTAHPNEGGTDWRLRDGITIPSQPPALSLQPSNDRNYSIAVINPNLRTPRIDQFNLTLEKRLWGAIFEIGYTGTRGKKLFQYANLNQTKTTGDFLQAYKELQQYRDMGTPWSPSNTLIRVFGTPQAAFEAMDGYNFDTGQPGIAADIMDRDYFDLYGAAGVSDFYIRNFPQFDKVLYGSNTAKSWYDSLQFGLRKSTTNYQLRLYYTWSKSLDTMSSDGDKYVAPYDSYNPDSGKAPSDFDRKHVLNIALDYSLPFGSNPESDSEASPWIERIFGGWNLGVLYIRESGPRFSVFSGRESQYAGVGSLATYDPVDGRPSGTLWKHEGIVYWFNPEQADLFMHPVAGEAGNSGRNSYVGQGYSNLDLMLRKSFSWNENKHVQFRIEAFNVFNKTHFSIPNTDMDRIEFGKITSTQGTPRALQVALRLGF